MDALAFPAAIISSWIIVTVLIWGNKLHREEMRTGKTPKMFDLFLFICIAVGGALLFLHEENTFIGAIYYDLIGGLLGLGTAFFALRLARLLKRPRPTQPPR